MIARYHSYNRTVKSIFINQFIIVLCQIISIIFSIFYSIFVYDFFDLTITNIISFVFFLIIFIFDICSNYNFAGKNILKLIPNIICLIISGFFQFYVLLYGMSLCIIACSKQHPLHILHGITFLFMISFGFNYLTTGIKLYIQSIYENKNRNNEHFVEENNNTIVTPNDINENNIGSDNPQN